MAGDRFEPDVGHGAVVRVAAPKALQPPAATYRFRATLVRVIDGDTYVLDVDLGFFVHTHVTVRLRGIDTPERNTAEGQTAALFAGTLLASGPIVIESFRDKQTFARWVCDVWVSGVHVADALRKAGHEKAS